LPSTLEPVPVIALSPTWEPATETGGRAGTRAGTCARPPTARTRSPRPGSSGRTWCCSTLRTRLLAALLALLAAVCVVVGVVSVLALDSFLMDRLDGQLTTAAGRIADPQGGNRPPPADGDTRTPPPGLADGTIEAHLRDGSFYRADVISAGTYAQLSSGQQAVLRALPADGRAYTRDLGGNLGD
jgi:hypothetical protein